MADKPKRKRNPPITRKRVQATENRPPPPRVPDVAVGPEPEEGGWDDEGLTVRQRLFVDALIGPAGGQPATAAEMAGYAAENRRSLYATASRLLTFVNVKAAVARRLARANLTPDWLRQQTAALAASNMGTFLSVDDAGRPQIDWTQAQALGAFVQIRKYKEKGFAADGSQVATAMGVTVIERTIEVHNPAPHLNLLAKLMGLVRDDGQGATVNVNVTQISEDDLVRIATRGRDGTTEAVAGEEKP